MNFGLDLSLNVGLEQKLSPQMIQSLKLLQMNSLELEALVKQEIESNPLIEPEDGTEDRAEDAAAGDGGSDSPLDPGDSARSESLSAEKTGETGADPALDGAAPGTAELSEADPLLGNPGTEGQELALPEPEKAGEIDWESYLEEGFDLGDKRTEELESPDERFERVPVYAKSLEDHLLAQLQDRHLDSKVRALVEYLVNSLDDTGFLRAERGGEAEAPPSTGNLPPEFVEAQGVIEGRLDLAAASKPVREAFHVLHSLEPAGIGARNLRECLLLQIRRLPGFNPLARRIVEEEFDLLEKLKIGSIAKKFEVGPETVQAALKDIGALEPRPGRLLNPDQSSPIVPDLLVEEVEGKLVLMLNDRTIPSLRISRAYAGLLKKGSKASTEEKKFVREKLNSATWLIRAIEQRKSTMIKVMQAIIESQPEFFTQGPTHLRPLILQDVADKIGMHISTVSRVTNGKYVQTGHGIFELKYFFTAGVTQSDGSEVSSVATKEEIKKLIESEDAKKPLSDQRIVEILKDKGLDVARRTVAKYRDQLEILPARLRKQY